MMGFERGNAPCFLCGVDDPTERCRAHSFHNAGQCQNYITSQTEVHKMDALEAAWTIIKAKKDAPNYRKATGPKKCGNCKAWDSSKTDDPMTGYCEWYDFNCRADHVCDAWAAKK
jgi:hypothetical protein